MLKEYMKKNLINSIYSKQMMTTKPNQVQMFQAENEDKSNQVQMLKEEMNKKSNQVQML